jgi:hypothetical protein
VALVNQALACLWNGHIRRQSDKLISRGLEPDAAVDVDVLSPVAAVCVAASVSFSPFTADDVSTEDGVSEGIAGSLSHCRASYHAPKARECPTYSQL